ncbi:MAG: glycosyl hydrolase family 18 protein [Clostridia bacterium]|nr:glycosyl hydrolase family 18 protein [Clostridia bacterium]
MKKSVRYLAIMLVICILSFNSVSTISAKPSNSTTNPPAPTLSYTPMTPTNGNVTVTVYYPSSAVLKQYKLGSAGIWTTYTAPVVLTSNAYVYARYQNSSGYWSALGGVSVSNIDKTAPAAPILTPDTTSKTNQDVKITVTYPADASVKQYRVGISGVWTGYSIPITVSSNTEIYAKARDAAGNWSVEGVLVVSNIDKTAPENPIFSISDTYLSNGSTTVTIDFSSDSLIKLYKVGNEGLWTDYTAPLAISSSDIIFAKACDDAGNWTPEVNYFVSNTDSIPPASPEFIASTSGLTNQDVIININYSADSVERQYKTDNSEIWLAYSVPVIMSSNGTLYARAADSAGNWSQEVSFTVDNIDKTAPDAPTFLASTTAFTNQNVTVSISYSADSIVMLYKTGTSGIWSDYNAPLILNFNDTIYAKASDSAGNWTSETTYTVGNIDTVAPEAPTVHISTTSPTDQPVTVTIAFGTDASVKQYRLGASGTWTDYSAPLLLSSNNTIYARSSDIAGNWSPESFLNVTNISKTVLGYTVKYWSTDVGSYNSMVANTSVLNEIATATYSVDGLGTLTGTAPADQIDYANKNGIRPKLMVSNNFDANIAKQLLDSYENRQNLKNNILNILKTYNYKGVDIDIENIPASCRNNFTALMSEIYSTLKPLGYGVSVAVQAKTYDSPNASWTYAFDYKSLAMYSDYLMIMAYDEHYPGGTPGAVASISWVTSVVDYALTVVPKEKIVLGLAAYGYDWANGTTKSYSINGCINLANQYGSTIYLDNATKSKYFTYTVNGIVHTVWFEDGETISYKLDLVNSKDLKGVGIWRLGLENSNYWNTIKLKLNK